MTTSITHNWARRLSTARLGKHLWFRINWNGSIYLDACSIKYIFLKYGLLLTIPRTVSDTLYVNDIIDWWLNVDLKKRQIRLFTLIIFTLVCWKGWVPGLNKGKSIALTYGDSWQAVFLCETTNEECIKLGNASWIWALARRMLRQQHHQYQ